MASSIEKLSGIEPWRRVVMIVLFVVAVAILVLAVAGVLHSGAVVGAGSHRKLPEHRGRSSDQEASLRPAVTMSQQQLGVLLPPLLRRVPVEDFLLPTPVLYRRNGVAPAVQREPNSLDVRLQQPARRDSESRGLRTRERRPECVGKRRESGCHDPIIGPWDRRERRADPICGELVPSPPVSRK